MARVKSKGHPDGRNRGRNHAYFPQLKGLGNALDRIIDSAPSSATHKTSGINMSDDGLEEKLSKQAAKLARRAKQAGHKS